MVVLQHNHSLSLIDLNPKYPHDEVVYDDDEDLIIKQAFQSSCDLCHQEITYYHRYYYKCDKCDYSLHKLCGEFPLELQHASHSAHTLTLFLDKSQGECHVCKSTSQFDKLRYHCSRCIFNICLECAMNVIQYHPIYHPSHQHPIIPGCRHRHILAQCDACGEEHKGVFYECSTCFRFLIHNDCVFRPKRLLIPDVTSGRFFHTHQLIPVYSFPRVYQKTKFDPMCRVCDSSFIDSENLWVYKCEKCRYYVHLKCINLACEPSDSDVGTLTKYQDNDRSIILHLPFFDQTQNMFTRLFTKETNAKNITHESHEHPLTLVDTRTKVKHLCNGCLRPIMDFLFYKCTYGCDFVLHEVCTRLPMILQGHKDQPEHCLYLNQKAGSLGACCVVCNRYWDGFFYCCSDCNGCYIADVCCALIVEALIHKSHPLHLLSRVEKRLHKDYCRMCLSGFRSEKETSFSCDTCNFHLHVECAFSLPETIRHRYDKHTMTLSFSPVENHEGEYFCEVCEEEFNPNACFYHCHKCVQSIHSACAQLKPLPKAYTLYGLNEKGDCGDQFTPMEKFHNHPLSFFKGTLSNRYCADCYLDLTDTFILKCLHCNFAIHAYHLNMVGDSRHDTIDINEFHEHTLKLSQHEGGVSCTHCGVDINKDEYVFGCPRCSFAMHAFHVNRKWRRRY